MPILRNKPILATALAVVLSIGSMMNVNRAAAQQRSPASAGSASKTMMQRADILWHNSSSNSTQIWFMEGHRIGDRANVTDEKNQKINVGLPWSIVGVGDFDTDQEGDIVWHNSSSRATQIWLMFGHRIKGRANVVDENGKEINVGPPWAIVGTYTMFDPATFPARKRGILWHNRTSNETQIWFMNGTRIQERRTVEDEKGRPIFVGSPWEIVAGGDEDSGIVWHNSTSNATQIWFMDRHKIKDRANVVDETGRQINVGPPWNIVGFGDFNRDGKGDIIWHNSSSNETQVWFMKGGQIAGRATVVDEKGQPIFVGAPWSIVGVNFLARDRAPADPNVPR